MRTPKQGEQSLRSCEEVTCAGCHMSWGTGEHPGPCCSLAKVSSSPSRCSAGAGSHFKGFLEQRAGLSTWSQSWAPHPYLLILARGCLTSDNQIIFLSAVKYSLKPSIFHLGQCLVGLCTVGGQARAPGGHWGTWQLSSHLVVQAEPVENNSL